MRQSISLFVAVLGFTALLTSFRLSYIFESRHDAADQVAVAVPVFNQNQTGSGHACSHVGLDRPSYPLRSKLMIIMSETVDRKGRPDTAHVVDNFQRYCARHGYLFKLHHYEVDDDLGVFGTRWKDAFKWWYMADWLLMVDSDTLVANISTSLDSFLNGPEHVLLHWRPNREVTAAAVAVRTTSFGRCFLERWMSVILTQKMRGREANADNGALLLLVAEFVDPDTARKCASARLDPFNLIKCYEVSNQHFGSIPTQKLPIRIFPLIAGFWRQHEGIKEIGVGVGPCYDQSLVEAMMFYRQAHAETSTNSPLHTSTLQ